jgi:antitoxin component YwqK of YwqJK toxin-antitoxin module
MRPRSICIFAYCILAMMFLSGCISSSTTLLKNGERITGRGHVITVDQSSLVIMDGEWTYYHESGAIREKGSYEQGVREGKWTSWCENGKKWSQGCYQQGYPVGTWKFWDESGNVCQRNYNGVCTNQVPIGQDD